MERKSFNEVLKQRELREKAERAQRMEQEDGHLALDDSQRVKVLSPGRLVFKRFIRNRLAIVGSAILIFMFLFSFVGAWIYPYGQTEKFHKFGYLFSAYANAQRRIDLTNYIINDDDIDTKAERMINSKVKELQQNGEELGVIHGETRDYYLRTVNDSVFEMKNATLEDTATFTESVLIGSYSALKGLEYAPDAQNMGSSFIDAVAQAVSESNFTFEYNGNSYEIRNYSKKTGGEIYTGGEGLFTYTGTALGAGFESACATAIENKQAQFAYDNTLYSVTEQMKLYTISKCIPGETVIISTNYVLNAQEAGDARVADKSFFTQALFAFSKDEPFEYDGQSYTVDGSGVKPVVLSADSEIVAEFSSFVVKDPAGKDIFNLPFKDAIEESANQLEAKLLSGHGSTQTEIEEPSDAEETGSAQVDEARSIRVTLQIPKEEVVDGNRIAKAVDENGDPVYADRLLTIEKKVNDYVISCDQLAYLIDIYGTPSGAHVFGTDGDGYDVLSRMMHGGQISLLVGFVVVILEVLLGTIMGGIAGYFGGWVDNIIMRLVDIFYCIPSMPILIIMGAFMDDAQVNPYVRLMYLMAILGFLGWAGVARLVRGQILSLREQEFMVATEATGVKVNRRIFRHLVPNVMPQLIVTATASLGSVIITESTLSFLGLGVKHPLATWGTMINSVTKKNEDILHYVYIWVPVGLLICLTVIAFNFVGDGLRDAFDPKMKK